VEFGKRLRLPIVGATDPGKEERNPRAHLIAKWLKENPHVDKFVILEDSPMFDGMTPLQGDEALWEKMKENFIQTDMRDGFIFVDFVNAFLALSELDIDEVKKKNTRMNEIGRMNAARWLGMDKRTNEQIKADNEEWDELNKTISIGEWAVLTLLARS
jgi:FtsZ-binding cell division protein ZapB